MRNETAVMSGYNLELYAALHLSRSIGLSGLCDVPQPDIIVRRAEGPTSANPHQRTNHHIPRKVSSIRKGDHT